MNNDLYNIIWTVDLWSLYYILLYYYIGTLYNILHCVYISVREDTRILSDNNNNYNVITLSHACLLVRTRTKRYK